MSLRQVTYRLYSEYGTTFIRFNRGKFDAELSAGTTDLITVRKEGKYLYVVSDNYHLDYAGMQVFNFETGEEVSNVFLQGEDFYSNYPDYFNYSIGKKINILFQYTI